MNRINGKSLYIIALILLRLCFTVPVSAADIWVAPNGDNKASGTKNAPFATVDKALREARELRRLQDPSIKDGIHIIVRGGLYELDEAVFIRPEDSGTAESPTIIRAATGETPVLSGGRTITGWQKNTKRVNGMSEAARQHVWVADAPIISDQVLDFRQLWINNRKATRAKHTGEDQMSRILSWDHEDESCIIPKPDLDDFKFSPGMEFFIHQWWAIANLRIKAAEVQGDRVKLDFYQPESRIQSEHPWPAPWISDETGNSAFYLSNSLQFLDSPGEWFLDNTTRKIYYWPLEDENLQTAQVVVPYLETLLTIQGTIDYPVSHVRIEGVSFRHSTWLRPSVQGHVPLQAGMYLLDAYKLKVPGTADKASLENQAWVGRPPAAVSVAYSQFTHFSDCSFLNLASTGLDYQKGNFSDSITGNLFKDVGGSGILIGEFSSESVEAHLPYQPTDVREISRSVLVSNNLITDVSNEDWGCVGIGAGFVSDILIQHNDISEVSYTGISIGWGWTPTINAMKNNRILANKIQRYGKHMYDVAGIYTLSAQPGSVIAYNYIDSIYEAKYAHLPDHWFYLYTDEGTAFYTIHDNWYPSDKTLQNANGPGNTWQNNGPQVSDSIKYAAGLQQAYQHLLRNRQAPSVGYNINVHVPFLKPVLVQVESADTLQAGIRELDRIASQQGIKRPSLFKWNNRFLFVSNQRDAKKLQGALTALMPNTTRVTIFDDLFYEFNRDHCEGDTQLETDSVKHIILSANLVADEELQSEYLNYHKVQFEEWPEVAKGFCNANFREVLLYRDNRQLLLLISIPAKEDFEDLNPKTVENNPTVEEWNRLMEQYQEGLPGTKPGEVWVFFEEI